jgi:hypothetical protein
MATKSEISKEKLLNFKNKDKPFKEKINIQTRAYQSHTIWKPIQFLRHMRKYPNRFFVVMKRLNGNIDMRYVYHESNLFFYENGVYIIDEDYFTWSDTLQSSVGHYHQGVSLPINYDFDVKALKDGVTDVLTGTRVHANVDAQILHSTVKSEMIQKLMRGEAFEQFMEKLKLYILIGMIGSIATAVILIYMIAR